MLNTVSHIDCVTQCPISFIKSLLGLSIRTERRVTVKLKCEGSAVVFPAYDGTSSHEKLKLLYALEIDVEVLDEDHSMMLYSILSIVTNNKNCPTLNEKYKRPRILFRIYLSNF